MQMNQRVWLPGSQDYHTGQVTAVRGDRIRVSFDNHGGRFWYRADRNKLRLGRPQDQK